MKIMLNLPKELDKELENLAALRRKTIENLAEELLVEELKKWRKLWGMRK